MEGVGDVREPCDQQSQSNQETKKGRTTSGLAPTTRGDLRNMLRREVTRLEKRFRLQSSYLAKSVKITMGLTLGAGDCAISSSLRYHGVVSAKASPAFQLVKNTLEAYCRKDKMFPKLVRHSLRELEGMFRDRKASPTEITEDGHTLATMGDLLMKCLPLLTVSVLYRRFKKSRNSDLFFFR